MEQFVADQIKYGLKYLPVNLAKSFFIKQSNPETVAFRKKGIIQGVQCLEDPDTLEEKKKKLGQRKLTKAEKKKYAECLYKIQSERFGERKIVIPNICSCGNLQKKLESLVKHNNIDVGSFTGFECANNCIYYKNKKEYDKCIKDLLFSIKNVKYETFHNKYKEEYY